MFGGKGTANLQYPTVVIPHSNSPYISIYNVSNTSTVKISDPSSLPGGYCAATDLDQTGRYLGVSATGGTPYVLFYERQGTSYTKLSDPASMPPNYTTGGAWDPTGTYYCAPDENSGANKFNVYKRSNNTMTLVTGITKPTGTTQCRVCTWNHNGTLLAISLYQTPYCAVYWVDRSTDTFTRITTPFDTSPTGVGYGMAFNQSGTSFAMAHANSPYVSIYNITYNTTTTSFTKIANPSSLPAGTGYGCDWNHDGTSLAVSSSGTPYIEVYNRSGDTFTKVSALTALTGGGGYGVRFSADGKLLFCGPYNSPYFEFYFRWSGDSFLKCTGPVTAPAGNCNGQIAVFPERS